MDAKQTLDSTTKGAQCIGFRDDGLPCQGFAVEGSRYCFVHSPERAGDAAAARRKGGRARHGRVGIMPEGDAPEVELNTPEDAMHVLEGELRAILRLEVSLSRARTVAALVAAWASIWGGSEYERRLLLLEEAIHDRKNA
jgi:hypothetical protein